MGILRVGRQMVIPPLMQVRTFVAHTERGVWYWPDVRAEADPSLFAGPESLVLTEMGWWYKPLR